MNAPDDKVERGIVYTFYSFKGGVGRTMALANVAVLLAKWGRSVLVVDWDLEAPGLERFFARENPEIQELRASTPGVLDLVHARTNGSRLDWRDCLLDVYPTKNSSRLAMITAGRATDDYSARLQSLNFRQLFDDHDLGRYIEALRDEWVSEFEFVLIDSRTGVTDIGGICTVHLADILVVLFTSNDSSTEGAMQIVERARKAQEHLPLDRRRLIAVPVPSRDESRTEYEKATQWKSTFANRFAPLYSDWLPSGMTAQNAIDILRIPYVPYWSFGEPLPVVEEGTGDPTSLGHAFEVLARLLAARLDWYKALEGAMLAPPPVRSPRKLDNDWLKRHRREAAAGLMASGRQGFMEVYHFCVNALIDRPQARLLDAAEQAMVHRMGSPLIGVVWKDGEDRPRPTNEGIFARVASDFQFAYWALNKNGDFYTSISLSEDPGTRMEISFQSCILRALQALLHCARLYRLLGVEPNTLLEFTTRYGGLRGRTLTGSPDGSYEGRLNTSEDEVSATVTFRLSALDAEIVDLVRHLCEPLFVTFDFAQFSEDTYRRFGSVLLGNGA